jgi:hypothetical protein
VSSKLSSFFFLGEEGLPGIVSIYFIGI